MSRPKKHLDQSRVAAFAAKGPRRVGVITFPGASGYDLVAASEVLSTANGEARRKCGVTGDLYSVEVVGTVSGPITLEMGLQIVPNRSIREPGAAFDTLIVAGGCTEPLEAALENRALIAWIRREAMRARRVASMCTGAFLLAEAGVFTGAVTTHWAHCDRLQRRYPQLKVQPDSIHVKQGKTYSSAGSTAAMDLAVALVEEDIGRPIAMEVARRLVMFLRRPGGQSQFSQALIAQAATPSAMNGVPEWILDHLDAALSVETLADRAGMSPRNFARVFLAEIGVTPAKFVERSRVERARQLIEDTRLPLSAVAARSGFADDRQMRRAFVRWLKATPSDYVERFRSRGNVFAFEAPAPRAPRRAAGAA